MRALALIPSLAALLLASSSVAGAAEQPPPPGGVVGNETELAWMAACPRPEFHQPTTLDDGQRQRTAQQIYETCIMRAGELEAQRLEERVHNQAITAVQMLRVDAGRAGIPQEP